MLSLWQEIISTITASNFKIKSSFESQNGLKIQKNDIILKVFCIKMLDNELEFIL